jgi:hypothetical protein
MVLTHTGPSSAVLTIGPLSFVVTHLHDVRGDLRAEAEIDPKMGWRHAVFALFWPDDERVP